MTASRDTNGTTIHAAVCPARSSNARTPISITKQAATANAYIKMNVYQAIAGTTPLASVRNARSSTVGSTSNGILPLVVANAFGFCSVENPKLGTMRHAAVSPVFSQEYVISHKSGILLNANVFVATR